MGRPPSSRLNRGKIEVQVRKSFLDKRDAALSMVLGCEGRSICFAPTEKFRAVGETLLIYLDLQDKEPQWLNPIPI